MTTPDPSRSRPRLSAVRASGSIVVLTRTMAERSSSSERVSACAAKPLARSAKAPADSRRAERAATEAAKMAMDAPPGRPHYKRIEHKRIKSLVRKCPARSRLRPSRRPGAACRRLIAGSVSLLRPVGYSRTRCRAPAGARLPPRRSDRALRVVELSGAGRAFQRTGQRAFRADGADIRRRPRAGAQIFRLLRGRLDHRRRLSVALEGGRGRVLQPGLDRGREKPLGRDAGKERVVRSAGGG